MNCPKHPKYTGMKRPKVFCNDCWAIFLGMSERCRNCGCANALEDEETEWERPPND